MPKLIIISLIFTLLSACQSVSVNISHINTDKGFLNSRLLQIGDLYLLDIEDNTLTKIANVKLTSKLSDDTFNVVNATNIQGVTINGNLDAGIEATVKAEISSRAFVRLQNARRVAHHRVYNDLSEKIEKEIQSGNNVGNRWELSEASQKNSNLRLVLISEVLTADTTVVGYDSATEANGVLKIPFGRRGSVNVRIIGASSEEFTGSAVPVFLNFRIMKVFINEAGNYDFKPDRTYKPITKLTEALRKL